MDKVEIETSEERRADKEVYCAGKWVEKMARRWGGRGKQIRVRGGGGWKAYDIQGIAVYAYLLKGIIKGQN